MRLGDLEALKEEIMREVRENRVGVFFAKRIIDLIDNAPTVAVDEEIERQREELYQSSKKLFDTARMLGVERPQGEWIPVSERLPEKTGYYLVTRKGFSIKNHVKRVGYDANTKRWSEGSIIAWQPLPEPYKEGGAKE